MSEVNEILSRCIIDGLVVKLPEGQLDTKLYDGVKNKLQGIGGKWKGGKVGGFVFEQDPANMLAAIANNESINLKKDFQFFPTPEAVADLMMSRIPMSSLSINSKVLEPSAGDGALVKAFIRAASANKVYIKTVECFELMELNRKKLEKLSSILTLIGDDFIKEVAATPHLKERYDVIIANPPFIKGQDITHIMAMWQCLKPGGTLVTLASPSFTTGLQNKHVEFRKWLQEHDAVTEEIEAGAFKESGTNVRTFMIVLEKPAVAGQAPVFIDETPALEESPSIPEGFPTVGSTELKEGAKKFVENRKREKGKKDFSELVISTKVLKAALNKAKGIVPAKPTLPALENIIFSASAHHLAIMATDLEVTLMQYIELPEPVTGTLVALIPFAWLNKVCSLYSEMPLVIKQEGKKLTISGENDVFEHDGLEDFTMYPELPQIPRDNMLTVNDEIVYWLEKAVVTAGNPDKDSSWRGKVFLEIMADGLSIASTNGHVVFSHHFPAATVAQTEVMLSQKVIKALAGFKETSIFWNDRFVAFESGSSKVIAVRPEGKYVAWRSVFPDFTSNLTVGRNVLANALEKMAVVNDGTCFFDMATDPSGIYITAENPDYFQAVNAGVPLASAYVGNVEKICLHPLWLQDLLAQVPYSEVALAIHDNTKAVLLRTPEDEGYLGLIMPIQGQ